MTRNCRLLPVDVRKAAVSAAAVGLLLLAGCAGGPSTAKIGDPDPPEKIYAKADEYLNKGKYEDAANTFELVDREHPYSPQARRSIVMAAYSFYKGGKYPEAIAAARRYTVLHPGTKEAPLAHHIIASSYYDEIKDPQRDQGNTRKALTELKILINKYPESQYARQAENRIRLAEDTLAASEMTVGRYYLKRRTYLAAINRFKTVASEYQTTAHVEEALMRLTECYMALGIVHEAQTAAAVLGYNFPNSRWYKDAYALLQSGGLAPREDTGSWLSQQWRKIVPGSSRPAPAAARPPAPPAEQAPPAAPAPGPATAPPAPNGPISSNGGRPPMGLGAVIE